MQNEEAPSVFIGQIVLDKGNRIYLHTVFSTHSLIESCGVGDTMQWPHWALSPKKTPPNPLEPSQGFKDAVRRAAERREGQPRYMTEDDNEWAAQWSR